MSPETTDLLIRLAVVAAGVWVTLRVTRKFRRKYSRYLSAVGVAALLGGSTLALPPVVATAADNPTTTTISEAIR